MAGWWTALSAQAAELWQQLLYALELATASAHDVEWVDTLSFLWDSLPDGDKLTTAERRQIAASLKHTVRKDTQSLYQRELFNKAAIQRRQAALAQLHLQQLTTLRHHEMEVMAVAARQQMRLEQLLQPPPAPEPLPAVDQLLQPQAAGAAGGAGGLLPADAGGRAAADGEPHVAIVVPEWWGPGAPEIQPASARQASWGSAAAARSAAQELVQPLLAAQPGPGSPPSRPQPRCGGRQLLLQRYFGSCEPLQEPQQQQGRLQHPAPAAGPAAAAGFVLSSGPASQAASELSVASASSSSSCGSQPADAPPSACRRACCDSRCSSRCEHEGAPIAGVRCVEAAQAAQPPCAGAAAAR